MFLIFQEPRWIQFNWLILKDMMIVSYTMDLFINIYLRY